MADSEAFHHVSQALAETTSLEVIEARGTLRIALRAAGLTASAVTAPQMRTVLERVMPAELEKRGIADGDRICERLQLGVDALDGSGAGGESPEAVFQRLGGAAR